MTEKEPSGWKRVSVGTDTGIGEQDSVETDGGTTDRKSIEIDEETDGRQSAEADRNSANHTENGTYNTGPDTTTTTEEDTILDGIDVDGTELTVTEAKRLLSILDGAGIDSTNADSVAVEGDMTDAVRSRPGGVMDMLLPRRTGRSLTDAPRIVRIVAEAAWRISDYSIRAQIRTTRRMTRAIVTSRSSEELLTETLAIAEDELKRAEDELRRQGIDHQRRIADRRDEVRNRRRDVAHDDGDPILSGNGTANPKSVATDDEPSEQESIASDNEPSDRTGERAPDGAEMPASESVLGEVVGDLPGLGSFGVRRFLSDAPQITRIVVGATRRVAEYSARAQVRTIRQMTRAVATSQSPEELLDETRDLAIEETERLGFDIEQHLSEQLSGRHGVSAAETDEAERLLGERGEQILRQSADVEYDEPVHPAYPHILKELSVDEARILRLLATEGAQPAVDVRSSGLLPLTSQLVAEGLSMVGIEAGCHHPERTAAYLGNLTRLGLVKIPEEPLEDLKRYQVLEAQPDVTAAREEARRPSIVYRSIRLTSFGIGFGQLCLSVAVDTEQGVGATESSDDTE